MRFDMKLKIPPVVVFLVFGALMYALAHYNKQKGVAALCIGGGEALAVAIERV